MEKTRQPFESPEVVESPNTTKLPTPTFKPESRNKEESSPSKDPTTQVAPPSPNIKKTSSNDRSSVDPLKKDNSTEASPTLPIRPPSPPAEQRKFLCVFCEKPLKTQQGLNRHLWAVHKRRLNRPDSFPAANPTLKSVSSPPKRGRWCTECANYVADGLSPENLKTQVHGTPKPVVDPQPLFFKCTRCDFEAKSKKGLFYHERQQHPKQTTRIEDNKTSTSSMPAVEVTVSTTGSGDTEARTDQVPPIKDDCPKKDGNITKNSSCGDGDPRPSIPDIALRGNVLNFAFPLCSLFKCPVAGCAFKCKTKNWFTSNNSLRRHISVCHRQQVTRSAYFCRECRQPFSCKPSSHPCFKGAPFLIEPSTRSEWECSQCGAHFPSRVGRDNHVLSHKRDKIKEDEIPVQVPVPSRTRKKNRRKKIQNLSEGNPSSTSLAAPPPPPNPFLVAPEVSHESPLINVEECQVLASFKDPLNQLLEVDDLPGAKPDFFALVEDIVTVVRDHFHLRPPGQSPTTARKALDLHDPQAVQKCYAWNRRKLIRQLTSNNTERCRIAKDTLVQHFSSVWQAPAVPLELRDVRPPERPPIISQFSPKFVASCLQSAENSAPGPDGIMYKHWREVDPGSKILCRVFNTCLKLKDVPPSWKNSSTILIHKDGEVDQINNWRPIALSNTTSTIIVLLAEAFC
ncbi:retrovirus-related Pol polyprotein from type-1 retrotransposable element R2 [Trichonephila inaurata madagascariensis]|uniref:Retrovirus-related Pol polyprotein from type-1 retrotransposable element R2 n=1 Tax=Trichonephila inaurata madagascariensis TaxID=2747483 RepID=A0A8X6MAG1_9ARAC|nr:retrovirus-related Pol polyprotein from type-1 retrotransposable element R2 [Trichonephila inaurata madagascariensis]